DLLPKVGDRSIKLGKIAETNVPAYYNVDDLTTHAIVAGATGGGKSISAQVVVEGALEKGIAVIIFDPTAQWSGMLRKCDDKKMLSFYPKFGLKPSDAKAYSGNVRQIHNEREFVDVRKFMNPGQIQIFTMSKLTPQQIDVFVAGVISGIFKTGPEEHPGLRLLLVFDEVHRLLPKFGGSGKGFLQIERACREFRKWGFGVMLVSQVLSDFVGEIKANINTEVQMRTRDESDLNRLKTKYGEEFLQSLIKASVGVGMFVNPKYNKGKPYFINFRPILHNTRRLTDAVLDQYNKYGEAIEDLEYQIEQLEQEKIDTFDLKMELKLVKDKLMTGNFTVVDIYLEGLKPRIEKQWESIGKKPKKREIELMKTEDIEASIKEAQKGHNEFEKAQQKEEVKTEKKEDISKKIVAPFTFENGMMISSLKELKDSLPSVDGDVLAEHVNESKNEIADWVSKQINPELGEKLKAAKKKEDFVKIINEFEKNKNADDKKKVDDKKDSEDKTTSGEKK
ncbi:MAG: helicase HerA-like domain-containing protein, partial [Patescibacteria group bacterium]